MKPKSWRNLGPVEFLKRASLQQMVVDGKRIALSYKEGVFGAISGACNHIGGPLGEGHLDGEYVVCPWHYWKFHRETGKGEPGYEDDCVPRYETEVRDGDLWICLEPVTKRAKRTHPPHPLARPIEKHRGPIRVVGISTTAMTEKYPRYSTSEKLLEVALEHAGKELNAETRLIRLSNLGFRNCEGFYSKASRACTWPCSITQMDPQDQLDQVYEAFVHWADVVLLATPIRWGAASALYYKMAERMNCIQNQITTHQRFLIKNKVASFIITGGQDNIQDVAGHLMGFFSELGFTFPPFAYIAHSRGWSAEDMESNIRYVKESDELKNGARSLVERSIETAKALIQSDVCQKVVTKAGRKAQRLTLPSARMSLKAE